MTITCLAHGTFDLLHPGHVAHLEAARALGDRLVVSITADAWVRKGPNRPILTTEERRAMLLALRVVDEVFVVNGPTGLSAVISIHPNIYIKGLDWEARQDDPDLKNEMDYVASYGGKTVFLGPRLHSSSGLAHKLHPPTPDLRAFLDTLGALDLKAALDQMAQLKVVVVGDEIRDVYHTVQVQGLTAKGSVVSLRHLRSESMNGGVLAIVKHLLAFTPHVRYVPLTDREVVKERFVSQPTGDQPLTKYFAVMKERPCGGRSSLSTDDLQWADLVVVGDFGHGAMTPELRDLVQAKAKFLAVNCQTNSANYGFNILSKQYQRCDLFSLDRTELDLAMSVRVTDHHAALSSLAQFMKSSHAFLTRGDIDTIATDGTTTVTCTALGVAPVDTLGAGDAFFAVVALAGAARLPIAVSTFLGQLAGAQAVRVVGNRTAVSKSQLLEHGLQLLAR